MSNPAGAGFARGPRKKAGSSHLHGLKKRDIQKDVSFLVRMFLTNLNFTLKIRLKAHIFPRTFADIASLCYDDSTRF